jgi:hypothetical protein
MAPCAALSPLLLTLPISFQALAGVTANLSTHSARLPAAVIPIFVLSAAVTLISAPALSLYRDVQRRRLI